jgi:hypothetical protein
MAAVTGVELGFGEHTWVLSNVIRLQMIINFQSVSNAIKYSP